MVEEKPKLLEEWHKYGSQHIALLHWCHERFGPTQLNVNAIHADSLTLNDKIAVWTSQHIGTMWFCYFIAALMIVWATINIFILPVIHIQPIDPLPFSLLFFFLGGIFQTLMLPMLMTAQNLDTRHSELRAEADHLINQSNSATLTRIKDNTQSILVMLEGGGNNGQTDTKPLPAIRAETDSAS